jgi:hypothetical protein
VEKDDAQKEKRKEEEEEKRKKKWQFHLLSSLQHSRRRSRQVGRLQP